MDFMRVVLPPCGCGIIGTDQLAHEITRGGVYEHLISNDVDKPGNRRLVGSVECEVLDEQFSLQRERIPRLPHSLLQVTQATWPEFESAPVDAIAFTRYA